MLTVCIEIAEAGSAVFIPDTLIVLNVAIARSTLFLIYAYLVIPAFLFHGTLAPKLDPVLADTVRYAECLNVRLLCF